MHLIRNIRAFIIHMFTFPSPPYPLLPRHCALLTTFGCEALSTHTHSHRHTLVCPNRVRSCSSGFQIPLSFALGVLTLLAQLFAQAKLSLIAAKPTRILPNFDLHTFRRSPPPPTHTHTHRRLQQGILVGTHSMSFPIW